MEKLTQKFVSRDEQCRTASTNLGFRDLDRNGAEYRNSMFWRHANVYFTVRLRRVDNVKLSIYGRSASILWTLCSLSTVH
ncbi:hypothetical protein CRM22_003250 [Opisthorchis felineus]|uniref:Uncharacterized protein n=1 Tax=Opisthorchis felineus TaxID=147828 RepID=A0A4S2M260_OPIFE|nr:hypothetical protein CRM22_003250 [Opisthorchis felineus]